MWSFLKARNTMTSIEGLNCHLVSDSYTHELHSQSAAYNCLLTTMVIVFCLCRRICQDGRATRSLQYMTLLWRWAGKAKWRMMKRRYSQSFSSPLTAWNMSAKSVKCIVVILGECLRSNFLRTFGDNLERLKLHLSVSSWAAAKWTSNVTYILNRVAANINYVWSLYTKDPELRDLSVSVGLYRCS